MSDETKEGSKGGTRSGLQTLTVASANRGRLMEMVNARIGDALGDLQDRPHLLKARVVDVQITITPSVGEYGYLQPEIDGKVKLKTPPDSVGGEVAVFDRGEYLVSAFQPNPNQMDVEELTNVTPIKASNGDGE